VDQYSKMYIYVVDHPNLGRFFEIQKNLPVFDGVRPLTRQSVVEKLKLYEDSLREARESLTSKSVELEKLKGELFLVGEMEAK
jgi:hypothetical protein